MFNVVLVEPEIPPNTGNVGRLCLATNSHLHLVGPLGFSIDERALKRAGLDYWPEVHLTLWNSFRELHDAYQGERFYFLSTKATRPYDDALFETGDFLVFGRETKGLPEALLDEHRETALTVPMAGPTRSLNLATTVAIVLFEGMRQLRHRQQ